MNGISHFTTRKTSILHQYPKIRLSPYCECCVSVIVSSWMYLAGLMAGLGLPWRHNHASNPRRCTLEDRKVCKMNTIGFGQQCKSISCKYNNSALLCYICYYQNEYQRPYCIIYSVIYVTMRGHR